MPARLSHRRCNLRVRRAHLIGGARYWTITSGPLPPNPSALLAAGQMQEVLEKVRDSADLVVIDSPPVLAVSDPVVLASLVDAVIVVVSKQATDSRSVSRVLSRLQQVSADVLGTVYNGADRGEDVAYAYGYSEPEQAMT